MASAWTIYGLFDPRTRRTRYVGLTDNPPRRQAQHLAECAAAGPHSSGNARLKWFRELREAGCLPVFEILESCGSKTAALATEARTIRRYLAEGCELTNLQLNGRKAREPKKKRKTIPPSQKVRGLRGLVFALEFVEEEMNEKKGVNWERVRLALANARESMGVGAGRGEG